MKTPTILIIILLPLVLPAQTTFNQVISSSGGDITNSTLSLSWTLGELATETSSNGDYMLSQGFQQPVHILITGIDLDLLVYLEGPYSGGSQMDNTLNFDGVIPLSQPYNTAPWNYSGTESVGSIPNANVIDWVYIQLRDAASPATAIPSSTIASQAAFLLNDGSVVGLDGYSTPRFYIFHYSHNLYAVIWHRNHLGILSANGLTESAGIYTYNFSTALTQVYNGGAGYKEITTGVYGMVAGDANADGKIGSTDRSQWQSNAGTKGYLSADFDMNNQVNNTDKNDKWVLNGSYESQVPE